MADAAAIADIYNQAVLHSTATFDTQPRSTEEREGWLTCRGTAHPVLVAEADGRVVGWASLSPWSDRPAYARTAEVSVYVDESARGSGVGAALMAALLERARDVGVHALLARVCTENDVSLRLSERFGFGHVGVMREVGEKFGRLLDVAVLELLL
ncbi:MAG TPA: GNAT family N-acetyltransferase [Coriobacteriia bacterium]